MFPVFVWGLRNLSRSIPAQKTLSHPSNWYLIKINRVISELEEQITMAKNQQKSGNTYFNQVTFVTIRLNKDQAVAFTKWRAALTDGGTDVIEHFFMSGYKTSITWDDGNSCFIISSTGTAETSPNKGKCMTSRSGDWYEGLLMNVFKHREIAKGDDWENVADRGGWG